MFVKFTLDEIKRGQITSTHQLDQSVYPRLNDGFANSGYSGQSYAKI